MDSKTSITELCQQTAYLLDSLEPDVFDNAINPISLKAFLDDARHTMFLAVRDQVVIGMISLVEYFHPDKEPQTWINEVGVAERWRGLGIGRTLVATAIEHARQNGSDYIWLGTETSNLKAQRCFSTVSDVGPAQKFLLYDWDYEDDYDKKADG